MIRTVPLPITVAFIFAMVAALPAAASAGGRQSISAEDAPHKPSALVVVADFNRDGIPDMAQVTLPDGDRSGPRILAVLLGRGDGTFRRADSMPVLGRDPQSIVVGDFNGDGFPDVIVGDGDGSLMELLNDGTGKLLAAREIAHFGSVVSIAAGDFDRDGVLDLAVSDARANTAAVLLGSGNGSFRPTWTFRLPMPGKVFHLAAADFNGDGLLDLAVTYEDEESFEVMIGNGNGTFTYAPALSHTRDPNSHCVT